MEGSQMPKILSDEDIGETKRFINVVRGSCHYKGTDFETLLEEADNLVYSLKVSREALKDIQEKLSWQCDFYADPNNETPEDMTAHINGLCYKIAKEALGENA